MILAAATLLGLALRGTACEGGHLHARDAHTHDYLERRGDPQVPLTPPHLPLVWGDFNVIHTTDTHGWLLGHNKSSLAEPYYNGTLGDFSSFVAHMNQTAIHKGVDLLLVDSGDVHDGTGLSDGYGPGGIDAHESNKFLERLPYDVMSIGNHELYNYTNAYDMYQCFAPKLNGRYLSSNVHITINSSGTPTNVSVGKPYVKFNTTQGRRVTSFGPLINMKFADHNRYVQTVDTMLNQSWFAEAIADEPDVFLLVGHMPVSNKTSTESSWPTVVKAVRKKHPLTPILIFGGHTHIRDCYQFDHRSMALQSGRYMETIGWMSANISASKGNNNAISFTRRYLDQNRVTYEYHTNTSDQTFDTDAGQNITRGLYGLANQFNLSYQYGTAPQDYTTNYDPYPSEKSLLSLFIKDAIPYALAINNPRHYTPNITIVNSQSLRFDVFNGSFTKNDQLTASEYNDEFLYIANVTSSIANQALVELNKKKLHNCVKPGVDTGNSFGYVTEDSCYGAGHADDTQHKSLPCYEVPHYISSTPPNVTSDTPIDVVFLDYFSRTMITTLNELHPVKNYTEKDVLHYSPTRTNEVLGIYAQAKWN
ncbi:Metallo-dependent phosphatase-like protein [Suillus ampliporus]|nr:Metallo-dependent phosphatase-like protein [Suillus ampliporus]